MVSPIKTKKPGLIELGVPKCIPPEFTALKDCNVTAIRERLAVLRKFSDLVSKSWKMIDLNKNDVSFFYYDY